MFAGTPREEKGIFQLCNTIKSSIELYPHDMFYIHTINSPNLAYQLETNFPKNVITNNNFLSGRPYFDFLMQGDVVLIPYNSETYYLRTSHIFMEALGLGRAVIVSNNSWMEELLNEFGYPLGSIMTDWTKEALLESIKELHQKRQEILENAYRTAEYIRNTHNPEQWVNLILSP